jgi:hypothetical protein
LCFKPFEPCDKQSSSNVFALEAQCSISILSELKVDGADALVEGEVAHQLAYSSGAHAPKSFDFLIHGDDLPIILEPAVVIVPEKHMGPAVDDSIGSHRCNKGNQDGSPDVALKGLTVSGRVMDTLSTFHIGEATWLVLVILNGRLELKTIGSGGLSNMISCQNNALKA